MSSEKVSKIILTIDEWVIKFENDNKVSHTDKETIAEFRDSLLKMENSMKELNQLHEKEKDPVRKMVLNASIEHGNGIQNNVERFIDGCCEEKHRGLASLPGDAMSVVFVNPPPNPLFFRGFFNNETTTEFMIDDIREGNGKRHQIILEHRSA